MKEARKFEVGDLVLATPALIECWKDSKEYQLPEYVTARVIGYMTPSKYFSIHNFPDNNPKDEDILNVSVEWEGPYGAFRNSYNEGHLVHNWKKKIEELL